MKKVLIVGSGISGLSAGIYAARSGFDVTILEHHNMSGGLSTGWSRKGYYFEGGMHWLTGSSSKMPLNRIWKEVGALQENNPIEVRNPLCTVFDGNKNLSLYRFLPEMKKALLEYSPEDKKAINQLYKDIKSFINFHLPVTDVFGCKCKTPSKFSLSEYIKMGTAIKNVPRLSKINYLDYISMFKNKNIRSLFSGFIGSRYNALSLIYTLASFASGDCGYPLGGSVRMSKNMEQTFLNLGGKIQFKTKVEKIIIKNGFTKGVQTQNGFIEAENVIVTQDTRQAIETLFEEKPNWKWANKMRKNVISEQNMFFCLGVKADLSHIPYSSVFPLEKPFIYANCKFTELRIYNYSKYKDHAPKDSTALTCLLIGESYDFWKKAKDDGTYKEKKEELGKLFIAELSNFIPEIKENLEVLDIATPCTYERYCKSYKGGWMSVWTEKGKQDNYPQTVKGIKGLYFAGQRVLMPGGLPLAVFTGRQAVQHLCKDTKTIFI